MKLSDIVNDYINKYREGAQNELRYFRIQRSLDDAIRLAALAEKPGGKRFSHQRRIPKAVLNQCHLVLKRNRNRIGQFQSFEKLFSLISNSLSNIKGVGKLMVYDTALRIGAYLHLKPELVYLHAGTRIGARNLGFDSSAEFIATRNFPDEFRCLSASEIEDVLCIYKDELNSRKRIPGNKKMRGGCH